MDVYRSTEDRWCNDFYSPNPPAESYTIIGYQTSICTIYQDLQNHYAHYHMKFHTNKMYDSQLLRVVQYKTVKISSIKILNTNVSIITTPSTMMWYSPRCTLRSHYLVHIKNNSYFVGMGPICDIEFKCIFRPVFSLCTLYRR